MWETFREEVTKYVQYVLNRECKGVVADDDMVSEVVVAIFYRLGKSYCSMEGSISTYIYYVIRSVVVDYVLKQNAIRKRFSYEEIDWSGVVDERSRFYEKFERILKEFQGLVREDFWKLITVDMSEKEYSNRLRSARLSNVKGVELVEKWLGRRLSEVEKQCLERLEGLLV